MDYLLSCDCGKTHVVSRSQAGQEIRCDCGKQLSVPTLRGLAALPVAESAHVAESTLPRESVARNPWQSWRGPTIAFLTAAFFVAVASCGWFLLQRSAINTSYTAESEIAAGNEIIDKADSHGLVQMWHSFGKMGLRDKSQPDFYWWNKYAEERELFAMISGVIAGICGLSALGVWFTARGSA